MPPFCEVSPTKSGHSGTIRFGYIGNRSVALKEVKSTKALNQEVELWRNIRHPCVSPLLGVYVDENNVHSMILPAHTMDLQEFLLNPPSYCSTKHLLYIALQVASALYHLETLSIVHNDVALRNVLLDPPRSSNDFSFPVKLTDFGLARSTGTVVRDDIPLYTCAPELYKSLPCTSKSDVYSFGYFLYDMFSKSSRHLSPFDKDKWSWTCIPDSICIIAQSSLHELGDLRPQWAWILEKLELCFHDPDLFPTFPLTGSQTFCKNVLSTYV